MAQPPSFRVRDVDSTAVAQLAAALRVRPVTARCLAARGLGDPGDAKAFLDPRLGLLRRPDGLAGFETAVARLVAAVQAGERIGVFGDYDVDGVTTAALLADFLRQVGAPCTVRVARRDAGYGFGLDAVEYFAGRGCGVVVTGDCGTSDITAIAAARGKGMDVVVVDHHTVPATGAAHPATALVNPYRADSSFPFRGLASVGLAFYLAAAVRTRLREVGWFRSGGEPELRELLDLVALGTIADLVPLRGENRILTAMGLRQLEARRRPGVAALLRAAGIDGDKPIDERTVAWKLGPRINAPGRLGDADPSLRLLLADGGDADGCAAALEEANTARRAVQDEVSASVEALLAGRDPGPAVVVTGRGWPCGVVGIVAAKLVDHWRRPAFVIAVDPATGLGRGSARSFGGVDLYKALQTCAPLMERFGGHAAAAGLTVREDRIDALRDALWAATEAQLAARGQVDDSRGDHADAEVGLHEVDEQLATELATLAPFGQDNRAPLLLSRGVIVRSSRRVGDGSHLKLELEDGQGGLRGAIGFGMGEQDPGAGARIDVGFAPSLSVWQGRTRVELELRGLTPSS